MYKNIVDSRVFLRRYMSKHFLYIDNDYKILHDFFINLRKEDTSLQNLIDNQASNEKIKRVLNLYRRYYKYSENIDLFPYVYITLKLYRFRKLKNIIRNYIIFLLKYNFLLYEDPLIKKRNIDIIDYLDNIINNDILYMIIFLICVQIYV